MKTDSIYISICSRKFNNNFLNLLKCVYINSLNINIKIRILIVFNQPNRIKNFQKILIKNNLKNIKHKIIYEKKLGISYARNKSLNYLKNIDCEYCCFLDDDCKIDDNFILNHLKFIKKNNCSIVSGPQIYKSKKSFFRVFERNFIQKKKIFWASTNNVFFKKKILRNNISFSNKVSKYGYGEDQLFFSKMTKNGEIIKWNNNPVYEISQKKRENFKWFVDRNFKYGLTGILIDIELYNFIQAYILNILKAFYNLIFGILYFFLIPVNSTNYLFKSIAFFIRFFGRMISLFKF